MMLKVAGQPCLVAVQFPAGGKTFDWQAVKVSKRTNLRANSNFISGGRKQSLVLTLWSLAALRISWLTGGATVIHSLDLALSLAIDVRSHA